MGRAITGIWHTELGCFGAASAAAELLGSKKARPALSTVATFLACLQQAFAGSMSSLMHGTRG